MNATSTFKAVLVVGILFLFASTFVLQSWVLNEMPLASFPVDAVACHDAERKGWETVDRETDSDPCAAVN